jgi:predicted nucleic acid-binding protein
MHAVAEKVVVAPGTAWHCCLEVYSVATRLPPAFLLSPADALRLMEEEVFARLAVHDLPAGDRRSFFRSAAADGTAGGRVYDAHIAEVARLAGARVVVTDNRRHFVAALRHGLRVETPPEFLAGLKGRV